MSDRQRVIILAYDNQSGERQAHEAGIPLEDAVIITDYYSERQLRGLHGCRLLNGDPRDYGGDHGIYLKRACAEVST